MGTGHGSSPEAAHFVAVSDEDLRDFAVVLAKAFKRLHIALDEPDFNLVLRSAPLPGCV